MVKKNERLNKLTLKYFLTNYGLNLSEKDVDLIYNMYYNKINHEIMFHDFLNTIKVRYCNLNQKCVSEDRLKLICCFYEQVKEESGEVDYVKLEKIFNRSIHPEVNKILMKLGNSR